MIVWLWARQIGFDAIWGFVRVPEAPEPQTEAPQTFTPVGFDHPVVIFRGLGDDLRFVDPACEACGPFEIPFELWSAELLSPERSRTPEPEGGDLTVTAANGSWTYAFSGTLALEARHRAPGARSLANWLGGPGSQADVTGLLDRGGWLSVTVRNPSRLYDPLRLAIPEGDVGIRVPPGARTVRLPAHGMPDAQLTSGALQYRRTTDGDVMEETLLVTSPWVSAVDVASLEAVRFVPSPP